MNVCVIITAAGRSSRFGDTDKLAQDLGGRSVLIRTVEAFTKRDEVKSIVVAGPPETFDDFRAKYGPTLGFHGASVVPGGRNHRWETVRSALNAPGAVPAETTHIAVHDAAKAAIQDRLAVEARRALLYSDDTAARVSYLLGFKDPSYFTRFFRRVTGRSPTAFRRQGR